MATSIPDLEITIQTGGDALRGDSSATAYVLVVEGTGTKEYSHLLKSEIDNSWNNDTTHGPIVWNLAPGITDENISRFGIRMQPHESGAETSDNWDIASVLVTYPDGQGGQSVLIDLAGGSLVRLTGSELQWETEI